MIPDVLLRYKHCIIIFFKPRTLTSQASKQELRFEYEGKNTNNPSGTVRETLTIINVHNYNYTLIFIHNYNHVLCVTSFKL